MNRNSTWPLVFILVIMISVYLNQNRTINGLKREVKSNDTSLQIELCRAESNNSVYYKSVDYEKLMNSLLDLQKDGVYTSDERVGELLDKGEKEYINKQYEDCLRNVIHSD